MKRTAILLLIFGMAVLHCSAQNSTAKIKHCGLDKISITLSANQIQASVVNTDKGTFSKISMDGFMPCGNEGLPELPAFVATLEIPVCQGINVSITNQQWQEMEVWQLGITHPLFPLQPSHSKAEKGTFEIVVNQQAYTADSFYHTTLVTVEPIGIARNRNLATLYFSPVAYNPASGKIKICTSADVDITFVNPDTEATKKMKTLHRSPMFTSGNTLNSLPSSTNKNEITATPIRYLIVAHNSFQGMLDTFADWKRRKGFLVDIAYTGSPAVGTTTTSIANYIKRQYTGATATNPAPTFLLLVGDVEQVPAFTGNAADHATDLYYATWTSGDILPDCYYGRFSAKTADQLTPQIEKTLMYEQYTMPNTTYLERALLIAGIDDGEYGDYGYTHADPTMKYLKNIYIDTTYGYSYVGHYDNSDYTLDQNRMATGMTHIITNLMNRGTSIAIYSAHGSSSGWYNPKFEKSDLVNLNNSKKIGLMIGNCCKSNTYRDDECFGEALLRLPDCRGAVGYIGGSNYTYWDEDYYWAVGIRNIGSQGAVPSYDASNLGMFDRLYHTHNEPHSGWYTTTGGTVQSGNMSVQNSSSRRKIYYWEIYHLMGDPSVMPWLHRAKTMNVTVPTVLSTGATSISVIAEPYSYVALTDSNLNLVAATFADSNGTASLNFLPLADGNYELAASAQGYKTNFTPVVVRNSSGIATAELASPKIHPNPAKSHIAIACPEIESVSLVDMLGNVVITQHNALSNSITLPLDNCKSGMYLLRIYRTNGSTSYHKIVVKK